MELNQLNTFDVLERITDGFYVLNSDWTFEYVNKEAERILKKDKKDLLGKCVWEEFSDAVYLPIYTHYQLAMETQQCTTFEFYYPSMNQWFDVRAFPSPQGLTVYFLDITESRQLAMTKDQYYQSLFSNHPDAVFLLELNGTFSNANDSIKALTGYTREELLNKSFVPLIVKEDLDNTIKHFERAKTGKPQNYENKIIHKNGNVVHCNVTNIPIIIDGTTVGIYGIVKNSTLQKITEENLEKAEKLSLVGQLSASIAHEIRNPLTTLKGFLQLLDYQKEIEHTYIDIMLSEMNRIESITSELLYLAKPQAVEFASENIRFLLHDVIILLQPEALMKNIQLFFEAADVGSIICVKNQLKQVFINLIKNAIESMKNGGTIKISLMDSDADSIVITFSDQGCGISNELAPNIGLPFYSTKEKGTGLGMVTTYKIIEVHGGTITFNSTLGKGTTFYIQLPKNKFTETSL
ncbi:PAS domain-containing sensor histidine kinase [Bacillus alkalicellulosilyticus]|uniref:PAS domain-containing sensor histidine kinase n=1 Tax=Alkalihalobacterium alkalicellulosilyticum TaxID=1912214 RepID=UPI000998C852|nr:PAS domain-containing sensor histidine kinase [Bacillus alkalicellulosilyticus]